MYNPDKGDLLREVLDEEEVHKRPGYSNAAASSY